MSETQHLMMLIFIIIIAAVLIIVLINMYRSSRILDKAQNAAKILLRGEILDDVIEGKAVYGNPEIRKMIIIRTFNPSKRYVFNPAHSIYIGRNASRNQIVIQDMHVSDKHCRIYKKRDRIILEDMQSANGTYVRRILKKSRVKRRTELRNADKVYVGDAKIQVYMFYVNTAFM